jgi:hypothetical protein
MRDRVSRYKVVLIFVGIVLLAGLFVLVQKHAASLSPSAPLGAFTAVDDASTSAPASNISDAVQPPPNTKEFQSNIYHFSLYYPDDLSATKQPGADGSMVVLFEDPSSGRGFDIFIAPYDQPKITQATFLMDEPSGVMNDPQNITIDGAPATEFFSTNTAIGASREIWFLHGGFLYEITTPQSLDSWLLQIMETWQFT